MEADEQRAHRAPHHLVAAIEQFDLVPEDPAVARARQTLCEFCRLGSKRLPREARLVQPLVVAADQENAVLRMGRTTTWCFTVRTISDSGSTRTRTRTRTRTLSRRTLCYTITHRCGRSVDSICSLH